jgi:hypothetical protein
MQTRMTFFMTHFGLCVTLPNMLILPLCARAAGSTAMVSMRMAARLILFCKWTTLSRGLERDVVYLGWPIASSYMSPHAGGRRELRGLNQWVQLYTWSQNKLWRSNSIFNLWLYPYSFIHEANIWDGGKTVHVCPTGIQITGVETWSSNEGG